MMMITYNSIIYLFISFLTLSLLILKQNKIVFINAEFDGETLFGHMTTQLDHIPCIRLFYSDGSIGCYSNSNNNNNNMLQLPITGIDDINDKTLQELKNLPDNGGGDNKNGNKYAVVISSSLFYGNVLNTLTSIEKVGAIIILLDDDNNNNNNNNIIYESFDVTTPQGLGTIQGKYNLNPNYQWNTNGNGIIYEEYSIPIVFISNEFSKSMVLDAVENNIQLNYNGNPLYMTDMTFYFGKADITSLDCITWTLNDPKETRSPMCKPLGGQSIWGMLGGIQQMDNDNENNNNNGKKSIMVTSGLDSYAFFQDYAYGVNDAVSSIISLLVTIDTLSRTENILTVLNKYNIIFSLFQGEEFGFLGSRKFIKDIQDNVNNNNDNDDNDHQFPSCENMIKTEDSRDGYGTCLNPIYPSLAFSKLSLNTIEHIIAIDSIGLPSSKENLYVQSMGPLSQTETLYNTLSQVATDMMMEEEEEEEELVITRSSAVDENNNPVIPPSPLTSVLQEDDSISGIVLTGYNTEFNDPRYHSHLDNKTFSDVNSIETVVNLLSKTLYTLGNDNNNNNNDVNNNIADVNTTLINVLFECLTEDWSCSLIQEYVSSERASIESYSNRNLPIISRPPATPTFYTSVISSYTGQPLLQRENAVYGKFEDDYDKDTDTVYVIPKYLEAFIRNFMAEKLNIKDDNDNDNDDNMIECFEDGKSTSSLDMATKCNDLTCTKGVGECVRGICQCTGFAFYHTALDIGFEATVTPDIFDILDDSAPLYTEPNWGYIGLSIYPKSSGFISYVALASGIATFCVSLIAARQIQKHLLTNDLLPGNVASNL